MSSRDPDDLKHVRPGRLCAAMAALALLGPAACRAAPEPSDFPSAQRDVAPIVGEAFSTEDARDRVFEPLVSTKPRGIGLGLAVSRSLTEANGGTLVLADTRGPGATFILTIPTACALEVAA